MDKSAFKHYMTGIPELDDAHWKLVEEMCKIIHLLKTRQTLEAETVLHDLIVDLTEHLYHEEVFMESINFPYYEPHKHEHLRIMATIGTIQEKIKHKKLHHLTISDLRKCIVDHIDYWDLQYVAWYKEHNEPTTVHPG